MTLFQYTNTRPEPIKVRAGRSHHVVIPGNSTLNLGAGLDVPSYVTVTPMGEAVPELTVVASTVEAPKKKKTAKKAAPIKEEVEPNKE